METATTERDEVARSRSPNIAVMLDRLPGGAGKANVGTLDIVTLKNVDVVLSTGDRFD